MHHGRKLTTALAGLAVVATIGIIPSPQAQAQPDIKDVQQRVDTLFSQAEQASERVNDAKIELADLRRDLRALEADQGRQGDAVGAVRQQVQDSIVSQYQGQALSAVGEVVVSDDPTSVLSGLSTMSAYNQLQSDLFDSYSTELKALNIRSEATEDRADQVDATRAAMEAEKKAIDAKLSEAQDLLDKLKAE